MIMRFTSFCPRLYLELLKEQAACKVIRDTITPHIIRWGKIGCLVHHEADPLTTKSLIPPMRGVLYAGNSFRLLQLAKTVCLLLSLLTKELNVICLWLTILALTQSHYTSCSDIFRYFFFFAINKPYVCFIWALFKHFFHMYYYFKI